MNGDQLLNYETNKYELNTARRTVHELADRFKSFTGLPKNRARTLAYWSLGTHGIAAGGYGGRPHVHKFPVLEIRGAFGTGKTTALRCLLPVVANPTESLVQGTASDAVLRDSFQFGKTALIDEGDAINETFIIGRYSYDSATFRIKRGMQGGGWEDESNNRYGATAVHRRLPPKDAAAASRCVTVTTRRSDSIEPFDADQLSPYHDQLAKIAESIDWAACLFETGRVEDTWAAIRFAADCLDDWEFVQHVDREIESAKRDMMLSQQDEPEQLVLTAVVRVRSYNGQLVIGPVKYEEIHRELVDLGVRITSHQLGKLVRSLGFRTFKRGGVTQLDIESVDRLREVALRVGLEDELLQ